MSPRPRDAWAGKRAMSLLLMREDQIDDLGPAPKRDRMARIRAIRVRGRPQCLSSRVVGYAARPLEVTIGSQISMHDRTCMTMVGWLRTCRNRGGERSQRGHQNDDSLHDSPAVSSPSGSVRRNGKRPRSIDGCLRDSLRESRRGGARDDSERRRDRPRLTLCHNHGADEPIPCRQPIAVGARPQRVPRR